MKYIACIFLASLFVYKTYGQVNMLIPLDTFPGANISDLRVNGDDIYCSLIYRENNEISSSAVMRIEKDRQEVVSVSEYYDFSLSYNGMSTDGDLVIYGMNREDKHILQVYSLDIDGAIKSMDSIVANEGVLFPVNALYGGDQHMYAYITDYDDPDIRTMLLAFSDESNELISKEYNMDLRYSYLDDMDWGSDASFFVSAGIGYPDQHGRYCQLNRLDLEGKILWKYNGTDEADNGAVACLIAPLSNGEIVQIYEVSGDQYPHLRMIWISEDGHFLRDSTIDVVDFDQLKYVDLIPGKGDYFYGYGWYVFGEDSRNLDWHGLLTKFNNDGTVIWSRMYQHGELAYRDNLHWLEAIHENDDGSIIILGTATTRFLEEKYMWLFEVDENGCFDPENCEDQQIITDISEVDNEAFDRLVIYPNPTDDILHILDAGKGRLEIIDLQGRQLLSEELVGTHRHSIDVSQLHAGVYICRIIGDDGRYLQEKVVVR